VLEVLQKASWLPKEALLGQTNSSAESSAVIRERVLKANNIQFKRQAKFNDKLTPDEIEKSIPLSKENKQLLSDAIDKFHLSARAYHRILKVANNINYSYSIKPQQFQTTI
jgi:magnesium chelatase family protein